MEKLIVDVDVEAGTNGLIKKRGRGEGGLRLILSGRDSRRRTAITAGWD
jgi:hypothetical protein